MSVHVSIGDEQVGNSVGVAVTGVLFFGALSHGYGLAFERSVLQMGALLLAVAALTWLLPGRQRAAEPRLTRPEHAVQGAHGPGARNHAPFGQIRDFNPT
jgi:hypothetical protein